MVIERPRCSSVGMFYAKFKDTLIHNGGWPVTHTLNKLGIVIGILALLILSSCKAIEGGQLEIPEDEPATLEKTVEDADGDEISDLEDNCPEDFNPDQLDNEFDGIGDVCDTDDDNDEVEDELDCCPMIANKDQTDTDIDGIGDACDNCPRVVNRDQADTDPDDEGNIVGDGVGDVCDRCPKDIDKVEPGICGCGFPELDINEDGEIDCGDACPDDPDKVAPGQCGCGEPDTDTTAMALRTVKMSVPLMPTMTQISTASAAMWMPAPAIRTSGNPRACAVAAWRITMRTPPMPTAMAQPTATMTAHSTPTMTPTATAFAQTRITVPW